MIVHSFLGTLPAKLLAPERATNPKVQTLKYFIEGVSSSGDAGTLSETREYVPCDVAVMLGWVHETGKQSPHLAFRQEIIQQQRSRNAHVVVADSNLFLYKNVDNPFYYLRYSINGVFPDRANYCDRKVDPERWQKIRQVIGLDLQPWRRKGNHVLICLQRQGGWSMGDVKVIDWLYQTVDTLKLHTNRPIIVRPHPGDKTAHNYLAQFIRERKAPNLYVSPAKNTLIDDLNNCWAVVNHNSSPAVAAAIEGIPVFVTDPQRSQAREIANTDLANIENPILMDRQRWIERLAMSHWSHDEVRTGQCWQHMRRFIT